MVESTSLIERLIARIDASGLSDAEASRAAGRDRRYLNGLRRRPHDMTLSSFFGICEALGIAPGDFFGRGHRLSSIVDGKVVSRSVELAEDMSIDSLIAIWNQSRGQIEHITDEVLDLMVVFRSPEEKKVRPLRVGTRSFASEVIGQTTVAALEDLLQGSDPTLVEATALSHIEALKGQPIFSIESGRLVWGGGVSARVDYLKLLLPVTDASGERYVLSYTKEIGPTQ